MVDDLTSSVVQPAMRGVRQVLGVALLAVLLTACSRPASDLEAPQRSPTPTLLEATPVTAVAPTVSSVARWRSVVWFAGHESGTLDEWLRNDGGGPVNTGTGHATATTEIAHSGRYALRMDIREASEDKQAVRMFRWEEPSALREGYFSAWFFFPERYAPVEWWNVFQFKSKPPGGDDSESAWSINVGNRSSGEMNLYLWSAIEHQPYYQWIADLPVGQWTQIEAFYRSSLTRDGEIAVWQDGVLLWHIKHIQTAHGQNLYWSLNNYTDNIRPSSATIYVDDAVISTERVGQRR